MLEPLFHWVGRLSIVVGLGCLSCTTAPPVPLTHAQLIGQQAMSVAVAPFNIALRLPSELRSSTQIILAALADNVRSHNKAVNVIGAAQGHSLWIESTAEVRVSGEESNFENAARILARKIVEGTNVDAVILPSLFVQNARIRADGTAFWDGAKQKIKFKGKSRWKIEMTPLATVSAASLLIYVFDRSGNLIHQKRTGLELIQHMEIKILQRKGRDKRVWTPTNDSPPIEDEARTAAAIAHSLSPFLPKARP